jgi:hypothetical protein
VIEQIGAEYSPDRVTRTVVFPVHPGLVFAYCDLAPILVLLIAMLFKFRLKTGPT